MSAMAAIPQTPLIERLPAVRGRLTADAPLDGITWFRVGGPAEVMFRPADREDLMEFLSKKPPEVPVTVIGVASNLLIRDGGVPGVVLRLGRGFAEIEPDGNDIIAGAAALDVNVAKSACQVGVGGLEFLCGVPGTIGGALRMNAGAYGKEIKDVLVWAEALEPNGTLQRLDRDAMGFTYRGSTVPNDWVFVAGRLAGYADVPGSIDRRMAEIQSARSDSQPIRSRTGGSTFKNPPGCKAWQLIDEAGCRGLRHGNAMVSDKHCNFLINTGGASAAELEALGEEVRRRVHEATGVTLEWEIKRIGMPARGAA